MFRIPHNPFFRVLLGLAVGAALIAMAVATATIFAKPFGLGLAEDFVFYKWFRYSRTESVIAVAKCSTVLGILIVVMLFDWRQYRRLKGPAINIALMITAIFITFIPLEAVYRASNGIPLLSFENQIARDRALLRTQTANDYHPVLGWVLKPNIRSNPDDLENSFTTGEFGVRMNSGEIKPVPTGAILAVGDSFTAGSEVGDPHSWPAQLERLVGKPVVNAGVGGFGAGQIILRAEELEPIVKPHTIIVSFLADDILRAGYRVYGSANKPWFDIDRKGNLVTHNIPVPEFTGKASEVNFPLLGYFHFVKFVMDRVGLGVWLRKNDENVKNGNDPVAVSCKLLERAHEAFTRKNIRVIFLLQHGGDSRHDRTSQKPHADAVVACAEAIGIETIDTWPPLLEEFQKGLATYKELFVMHDENRLFGHMNSKGNALIARLIAEKLQTKP